MDRRSEIRDFLTTRRVRVTPEQAGLTLSPLCGTRRVPGLRREEAPELAGVSVPYCHPARTRRRPRSHRRRPDAIARILLLDDAEGAHLFALVRAAHATGPPRPVRPGLRNLVETISGVPAYATMVPRGLPTRRNAWTCSCTTAPH
ncbi:hypothetical protein ABTX81_37870 [Kitasatospora sp. NPDC097605]|uniref:hypothetical protein n=1 Tax=Kitasatospora sp. NPDC097605 TaxID=3157226 RepID=UPI0033276D49